MRRLAFGLAVWLLGCAHEPRARNITGPDGSPMVHVSCGSDQSACFELAGRSCPTGYNLFPIFDAHDNNYLVRCQASTGARSSEMLSAPLVANTSAPPPAPAAPIQPVAPAWTAPRDPASPALTRATNPEAATDWGY
ncbi:MAG: hypothetical protein ACOY0T_25470 [Myxococcota bacterium]